MKFLEKQFFILYLHLINNIISNSNNINTLRYNNNDLTNNISIKKKKKIILVSIQEQKRIFLLKKILKILKIKKKNLRI